MVSDDTCVFSNISQPIAKYTDKFRVKKKSRKNFKDMLARTPDIGGFTKNPLRICLSGGIVWMAVYKGNGWGDEP